MTARDPGAAMVDTKRVARPQPKVALACIGIGRVQRGFERYFGQLFDILRNELPVALFRGAEGRRDAAHHCACERAGAGTGLRRACQYVGGCHTVMKDEG